jgi:hypothetical protein
LHYKIPIGLIPIGYVPTNQTSSVGKNPIGSKPYTDPMNQRGPKDAVYVGKMVAGPDRCKYV